MPELPLQKRERYINELGLSEYDADVIVDQMETARFFDRVVELGTNVKTAINWLMGDITAYLKDKKLGITETKLTPENLDEMIELLEAGTISSKIAKDVIVDLLEKGGSAQKIVEENGLVVISDEGELKAIINRIIEANPGQVAAYRGGKDKLFGFFVGQVMKETKGLANPQLINTLIKEALG